MFSYYVRIHLLNGEFFSASVTCNAKKPPTLWEVLEINCEKFFKLHSTPTGDIYGYLKRYDQEWEEFIDVDPVSCLIAPVRPKDKIELWYSPVKQHPHAVLLPTEEEPVEEEAPLPVVPEIRLQIFRDNNFMVEKSVSLTPGVLNPITELIKNISVEYNLVESSRYREVFGWIMKKTGHVEANLDYELEGGTVYQLYFVEFDFMIKDDLKAYFKLSNYGNGGLRLDRFENQNHGEKRHNADALCNIRLEDLSKCKHEEIPKEVTPVNSARTKTADTISHVSSIDDRAMHKREETSKVENVAPVQSLCYLKVEKNNMPVTEEVVTFDSSTPLSFQRLIDQIDADHNVFAESASFRESMHAWIFKVVDEQNLDEVDLNGVAEDGVTYHVSFAQMQYGIKDGASGVFKISYGGQENKKHVFEIIKRRSECNDKKMINDSTSGKSEQFSKKEDQAGLPTNRQINVQVFMNERLLRDVTMLITRTDCPSFKSLLRTLHKNLKTVANVWMYVYAWILKEVGENQYEEVDLDGVVEEGATYQVHFTNSYFKLTEGVNVAAYFKISCNGSATLEYEHVVSLRGQKNKENNAGRLETREEHVPNSNCEQISSHEVTESSHVQTMAIESPAVKLSQKSELETTEVQKADAESAGDSSKKSKKKSKYVKTYNKSKFRLFK